MKPHLHFMGIGGIGMSALARWYRADGYPVSGCDQSENEMLSILREHHIDVSIGHDPKHIDGVDTLISSAAVHADHPELQTAHKQGKRVLKRIELLAELLAAHDSVAVTGSHGKSTTTAMIATVLLAAKLDPSVLIGAQLASIGGNVHYGQGRHLIAEVDESDPGFAALRAELAVITNLEDDHIAGHHAERRNYHASLDELERAMKTFAEDTPGLLYCSDCERLKRLFVGRGAARCYGQDSAADYRFEAPQLFGGTSHFDFVTPQQRYPVNLNVPGLHNILNATAALATADMIGIDLPSACQALSTFSGVGRRWQRLGSVSGALIIDDYAVHPTELRVILEVARETGRHVRAVLQPHRWVRTAQHWSALADAASLADEVLVLDIYAAGEAAIAGISPDLIVDRLKRAGTRAAHYSIASAEAYLATSLGPQDLILTIGAGDVWKVGKGLLKHFGGDDGSA